MQAPSISRRYWKSDLFLRLYPCSRANNPGSTVRAMVLLNLILSPLNFSCCSLLFKDFNSFSPYSFFSLSFGFFVTLFAVSSHSFAN